MVDLGQKGYAMRAFFFAPKSVLTKIEDQFCSKSAFHRLFNSFNNFFMQA